MKNLLKSVAVASLIAVIAVSVPACSKEGTKGGTGEETFKLQASNKGTITVKKGSSETVDISLDKSAKFNQTVSLKVAKEPAGIKAKLASSDVKGDGKATLTIEATKDATVGDGQAIVIEGTPEKGDKSTLTVTVNVKE
jgi:hypothetical protein